MARRSSTLRWCLASLAIPLAATADATHTPPRPQPPRVTETPPTPTGCLGRWVGVGRNTGSPPWSIDMVLTAAAGARCGTIEYPSLGCGGYLTQCRQEGAVLHAVEVYTHNPGTCSPAGTLDLQCRDALMDWRWTGDEVVSTRLRRAND